MFIGHLAVGFAAKKFAPRTTLGALIEAPMLLDLVFTLFFFLGLEEIRIEPGHTVVGLAVWLFVLWVWWFDKRRAAIEVKPA